jgi:hypothetical protein
MVREPFSLLNQGAKRFSRRFRRESGRIEYVTAPPSM